MTAPGLDASDRSARGSVREIPGPALRCGAGLKRVPPHTHAGCGELDQVPSCCQGGTQSACARGKLNSAVAYSPVLLHDTLHLADVDPMLDKLLDN